MRFRAALFGWLLAMLPGCGPEAVIQAELGEVCGEAGPFRVLELAPEQQLKGERPLHVGDRVLYLVDELGKTEPEANGPNVIGTTVWATGPCGESPVLLATGIRSIFTVEAWPDVPLGCVDGTGDVVVLDPSGVRAPHVIFSGLDESYNCTLRWTKHGALGVSPHGEGELGVLRLYPYPADPYTETSVPLTLLDPVRLVAREGDSGVYLDARLMDMFEDFVYALTSDNSLVRVDLANGAMSMLQTGVLVFEGSREGKYVMWQSTTVTLDDPELPEGEVYLRDVAAGTDALLAETSLPYSLFPMRWAEEGVVQLSLGYSEREPQRLFFLPGLESFDVEGDFLISDRLDEERWLVSWFLDDYVDVFDLRTLERRRLSERAGWWRRSGSDAIDVLEVPKCCIVGTSTDEGPLWRVPIDGSPPTKLAKRAIRLLRTLEDGRIVSPVGIDKEWFGTLALIETDTQAELRIDDRVFAYSADVGWGEETDIVSYSIGDEERSGVYLARLPADTSGRRAMVAAEREGTTVDVVAGPDGRPVPRQQRRAWP